MEGNSTHVAVDLGPLHELNKVFNRHISRVGFQSQVSVIGNEHNLPVKSYRRVCNASIVVNMWFANSYVKQQTTRLQVIIWIHCIDMNN